jgi:monothiol glutaredoxin
MTMDETLRQQIQETVDQSRVVLFMKGTKNFPQCGFSARVVQILKELGADFKDVNILTDPELRQGLKEFSNWPTFPQLYVGGELVGGCDIVVDLHSSGELQKLVGEQKSA